MEINENRDRVSVDTHHLRQYWTNRLLLFAHRMEQEGRVWDVEDEVIAGVSDEESRALRAEFDDIADNLGAAGVDVDAVIWGIESGAVSYNPHATDPPVVDLDAERRPPEVIDSDQATVEFSAEEWDAKVDWPGYEW